MVGLKRIERVLLVAAAAAALLVTGSCENPVLGAVRAAKVIATVSGNTGYSTGDIATDTSSISVAFYDPIDKDLRFAASTDGGSTWTNPATVVDSTGDTGSYAEVTGSSGSLTVNYWDSSNTRPKQATSADAGTSWVVKPLPRPAGASSIVETVTRNGFVYCFNKDASNNLRCSRSSDGGTTWPMNVTIAVVTTYISDNTTEFCSLIVFNAQNLAFFWIDGGKLWSSRTTSADTTCTWTAPQALSQAGETPLALATTVLQAAYCVAYYDNMSNQLMFIRSDDEGVTWQTASRKICSVSTSSLGSRWLFLVSSPQTLLDVVFVDLKGLSVWSSADSGGSWTLSSTSSGWTSYPIACRSSGDALYMLYPYSTYNNGQASVLCLFTSKDHGLTWY
jgi:hypothetical protein